MLSVQSLLNKFFYSIRRKFQGHNLQFTFFLNASHFSPKHDFLEGTTTISVLVLLYSDGLFVEAYWTHLVFDRLDVNSSLSIQYPFFAKSDTFVSFNFWNAEETTGGAEEKVDLNFPNSVSDCPTDFLVLASVLWEVSVPDVVLPPSFALNEFVEAYVDSEDAFFPSPKVSLT